LKRAFRAHVSVAPIRALARPPHFAMRGRAGAMRALRLGNVSMNPTATALKVVRMANACPLGIRAQQVEPIAMKPLMSAMRAARIANVMTLSFVAALTLALTGRASPAAIRARTQQIHIAMSLKMYAKSVP